MDNFVPYLLVGIVVAILVSIGYVLCIIPGLIAWFFLFFSQFFAADKGMGVGEALGASARLMNDNLAKMVGFFLGSLLAIFIGALLCGIGLLVAYPVVLIATAYMYKACQGEPIAA